MYSKNVSINKALSEKHIKKKFVGPKKQGQNKLTS